MISDAVKVQKEFFESGGTRDVDARIGYIRRIKEYIIS